MGRPLRIEYPGAFYHVAARGNERRNIFNGNADRKRFLDYLASATARYGAVIHAWCLMSNHYHLLLETPEGNLSQIMRHINGAYTNYFNAKHRRAGHLFQGRYKSTLVDRDTYALELSRYIHLNPVRAGMSRRPEEYVWSSYRRYIGLDAVSDWLYRPEILGYFEGDTARYQCFVEDGLTHIVTNPFEGTVASVILGEQRFVQRVETSHLSGRFPDRDVPELRKLSCRWSVEEIVSAVDTTIGEDRAIARKVAMYLCHRHSGATLREIGDRFAVGESAVSQGSRRLRQEIQKDDSLKGQIERICLELGIVNV